MEDDVERLAEGLQATQARVTSELIEIEDNPTYKLLAAGPLSGATELRSGPAVRDAPVLWTEVSQWRQSVTEALGDIDGRRVRADERHKIARLLNDLTDEGERLSKRVAGLRDAVSAVEHIWHWVVPHLDDARSVLSSIESLGDDDPSAAALRDQADDLQRSLADDPLGVSPQHVSALEGAIAIARQRAVAIERGRASWHSDIAATYTSIAELTELGAAVSTARAESAEKIRNPSGLRPTPVVDPLALRARLAAIETGGTASFALRRRQLDRLIQEVAEVSAELVAAVAANRAPLMRRDELRGLLQAYRAKASSNGLSEDGPVQARLNAARDVLYSAPTDLDEAERLVAVVAKSLSGSRRRGPAPPSIGSA